MTYTAENCAGQVQGRIPQVAELVVYIISEDIQEEHIAGNVPDTAVQEGVTEELMQVPIVGDKHEFLHPVMHRHGSKLTGYNMAMWAVGQNKNN
jgi:hypothetical protein